MLFYLGTITCFLIKSAKESLFFTSPGRYGYFTMTSDPAKATNFYLKRKGDYSPGENYIGIDSEQFLSVGLSGQARQVTRYKRMGWWVDSFKFELTDKGTFLITKDGKCLGYDKPNMSIKLFSCDSKNSNISMIMEGGDSIGFSSHRVLHEVSTADEHRFNSHSDIDHSFEDSHAGGYLSPRLRYLKTHDSHHLH